MRQLYTLPVQEVDHVQPHCSHWDLPCSHRTFCHHCRGRLEGDERPIDSEDSLVVRCVLLVGALFSAIGIFASSFTKNQLVAASTAVILNLFIFFVHYFRFLFEAGDYELRYFQYISPLAHFGEDFTRGVFDYRYVTLYLSFSMFFLFLGVKSLERRRWW